MDRCHTNQCLKSHEKTSHLNYLPLLWDCMTFSKPSALQADEVNFLYSTLYSCSTTWRGSKVCNQKEIFLTVLIRGRKGDLIAGEVASSQSLDLIIPRAPCAFRVTWSVRFFFFRICIDREGLGRPLIGTKQGTISERHLTNRPQFSYGP